jgi:flagellar biogenesis protein FliO
MKRSILLKSLILSAILFFAVPSGFSQAANTDVTNSNKTEVMGENERLPFLLQEENPETQEPSSGGLLLKTVGAMLLIVGLIFCGAWALKKLGFGGVKGNGELGDVSLAILSSVSMGSGRTISTIRFGERVFLVGATAHAFTLLAEETASVALSSENARSVAEMLAEETNSFHDEFRQAQNRLGQWDERREDV